MTKNQVCVLVVSIPASVLSLNLICFALFGSVFLPVAGELQACARILVMGSCYGLAIFFLVGKPLREVRR